MWLELGVLLLLLLAALQGALMIWQGRQLRRLRSDCMAQINAGDVPTLLVMNTLSRVEQRLDLVDVQLARLAALPEAAPAARPPATAAPSLPPLVINAPAEHNYELAQQLARQGASLEQLMSRCGLTRDEAELVQRLYGGRPGHG